MSYHRWTTKTPSLTYAKLKQFPNFIKKTGWKDPQCIFRVEEPKISSVPTLVKWGTSKRLGDDYCNDESMVEMFFEDE